ncbi:MAG: hypothetical protein ACYSTT_23610 [Planctomycetota bacterium]
MIYRNGGVEQRDIWELADVTLDQTIQLRIDRVGCSDGSHPEHNPGGIDTWPVSADGVGKSLTRIDMNLYCNDPSNWEAANPSPRSNNT